MEVSQLSFAEKYNEQFITQTIEMKQPSSSFRELILKYGGAKKDSDRRKEKHRLRKGAAGSPVEPAPKREKEEETRRCGSNPPLSKLKIPRALVNSEKKQKHSKVSIWMYCVLKFYSVKHFHPYNACLIN